MICFYFKLLLNAKNNSNNHYIIFLSQSYNHHTDHDMIYNLKLPNFGYTLVMNYQIFFEFLQTSSLKSKHTNASI